MHRLFPNTDRQAILTITFFFVQGVIHNLGHPVTPAFVKSLSIPDYMFGVFFALMSFGLMLGGPFWGILADRGKKTNYMLLGLIIYSLGQIGFAYSGIRTAMVFFRFLSGFGVAAAITLLTSHIIEISSPEGRAKNLAYTSAAFIFGTALGYGIGGFLGTDPSVTGFLRTDDFRVIFLIQAITNAVYAIVLYASIREVKDDPQVKKASMLEGLKAITRIDSSLLIFLLSLTLMTIGHINLNKYIDVYFNELGYSPQQLGNFVMVTGIASIFANVFILPLIASNKRQLTVISFVHILSALIVLFVFRASAFLLAAYTIYLVYVMIKAMYQPLEQNFISTYVKDDRYASVMGLRQSFVAIGMVIGPLVGGFLYDRSPLLLFDFNAGVFILGVMLLPLVHILAKRK
ncbi:MAG: MFS transporter, partial [Acholeplasmataceae bacterium]